MRTLFGTSLKSQIKNILGISLDSLTIVSLNLIWCRNVGHYINKDCQHGEL
jgi:hypothetical protein